MKWNLVPFAYYDPYERLGYNQLLLEKAKQIPFISLTGWDKDTVSVGFQQDIKKVVAIDEAQRRNLILLRRESGGGATVLTKHDICWGIIAHKSLFPKGLHEIYKFATQFIIDALHEMGIEAEYKPINDIVTTQGKISGSALKQVDDIIYMMGTLLYKSDKEVMDAVLHPESDYKPSIPESEKKVTSISDESDVSFENAVEIVTKSLIKNKDVEIYKWSNADITFAKEHAKMCKAESYIYAR